MAIQIGLLIRKVLKDKGMTSIDLARLINRHPKTVANILKRKTIDTDLLISISKGLDHDFFEYFYELEPLKSIRLEKQKVVEGEMSILKIENARKEDMLISQNKYIKSQEDVIRLLKEKEQFLRPED